MSKTRKTFLSDTIGSKTFKRKRTSYRNQTRDSNGKFGTLKVKSKQSILKANSRDFKDAKSKLINIKSMPKIKFKYFIFICF